MDGRDARQALELADYRARVAELYLTSAGEGAEAVEEFRHHRDRLFAEHPASALTVEQKAAFEGLPYFPYAPMAQGPLRACSSRASPASSRSTPAARTACSATRGSAGWRPPGAS